MTRILTCLPARWAALLAFSVVLSACATAPGIRTAGSADADFQSFRTFGFIEELGTDRAGFHELVSRQLVFSTRRELEVRGLTFVDDPAKADLLVNFYADLADRLRVRNPPAVYRGSTYWNFRNDSLYNPWPGHRQWPTHTAVQVDRVTQGTLSVDVVDARRNVLVWEGVATGRLTQQTLDDLGPALDVAVDRLFRDFPIEPVL